MDSWTCGRGSVVLSARHSLSNHQTLPSHGTERLKGFSRTKKVAVCGGGGAVRVVDCGQAKAVRACVRWLGIRHTVVVYSLSLTQRPPCHLRPRRCFYLNLLLPEPTPLLPALFPRHRHFPNTSPPAPRPFLPSFLPPSFCFFLLPLLGTKRTASVDLPCVPVDSARSQGWDCSPSLTHR